MPSEIEELKRLQDIQLYAERVAELVEDVTVEQFKEDWHIHQLVERQLQNITEAVIVIGEQRLSEIAPSAVFHEIRGVGNRLRHEYGKIDHELLFEHATTDVPQLVSYVEKEIERQTNLIKEREAERDDWDLGR